MRLFISPDELAAELGRPLGSSGWLTIQQERVNAFAEATGDHQWIHVDPERATAGPFGAPVAHGYLTLSLLPMLVRQIFTVQARMAVNYGLNRVRFPAPVRVGSRVRATSVVREAHEVVGGIQVVTGTTIEIQGGDKPACVVEAVARYFR